MDADLPTSLSHRLRPLVNQRHNRKGMTVSYLSGKTSWVEDAEHTKNVTSSNPGLLHEGFSRGFNAN